MTHPDTIRARANAATPGPWWPGHLTDDGHPCNCSNVLSNYFAGAICSVNPNNGKLISDGGNDGAPLEEAKANILFIANARTDIPALCDEVERLRELLKEARSFVELTYDDEGGEEAADAKHVLDKIDAALSGGEGGLNDRDKIGAKSQ